jgi:hypothetical protein
VILRFRVFWEIEIDAESPERAAQQARTIQLTPDMPATMFNVWGYTAETMYRLDSVKEADKLDRYEQLAARGRLRFLQCNPGNPANVKGLAAALLIFLDKDEMMFKDGRGVSLGSGENF